MVRGLRSVRPSQTRILCPTHVDGDGAARMKAATAADPHSVRRLTAQKSVGVGAGANRAAGRPTAVLRVPDDFAGRPLPDDPAEAHRATLRNRRRCRLCRRRLPRTEARMSNASLGD